MSGVLYTYPVEQGKLCRKGHDDGTGHSMRFRKDVPNKGLQGRCRVCEIEIAEAKKTKRKKKPKAVGAPAPAKAAPAKADGPKLPPKKKAVRDAETRRANREEQAAMLSVIEDVAGLYTKRFRVEYDELVSEGWVHALEAFQAYWVKCDTHSLAGLRGWVYRWVRVRLAMFTRKATSPVSFPKKAVPQQIRDGVRSLQVDLLPLVDEYDVFEDLSERQLKALVDETMGDVIREYPLARRVLREELAATTAAHDLDEKAILREVRRQATAARKEIRERLEVLFDQEEPPAHDCQCPIPPRSFGAPRGSDRCAT